jgi:hypothetical protein
VWDLRLPQSPPVAFGLPSMPFFSVSPAQKYSLGSSAHIHSKPLLQEVILRAWFESFHFPNLDVCSQKECVRTRPQLPGFSAVDSGLRLWAAREGSGSR